MHTYAKFDNVWLKGHSELRSDGYRIELPTIHQS
jgi:hypothetical protein